VRCVCDRSRLVTTRLSVRALTNDVHDRGTFEAPVVFSSTRPFFGRQFVLERLKAEIAAHGDGGYHYVRGPLLRREVSDWFRGRELRPLEDYIEFLCTIGPGVFFGGALVIHPLSSERLRSVESDLLRMTEEAGQTGFLPFGYDGTTESCYCLESQTGNDGVHWFSWEDKTKRSLSPSFCDWVEAKPRELYKDHIYAGYKTLTNVDQLAAVMQDRSAFAVRLLSAEKRLQRPPDKPKDLLPRYNKLVLSITKTRPVSISVLTVMVARLGSQLGAQNVEYVTVPVADIPINVPTIRECYVFDPFNVPFSSIQLRFSPVIDLGTNMRVKFKELANLLT